MSQNFVANAAGSLGQARGLILQQLQQIKITAQNYDDVFELLRYVSKIETIRGMLEVIGNRFGELPNDAPAARAASAPRLR